MRTIPLSSGVATRRASVAVLCTVLVAACDSDTTLSPKTSSTPASSAETAAAALTSSNLGGFVIKAVDVQQNLIGGAKFQINGPNLVGYVTDNGATDMDPTFGKIYLPDLPLGNYKVCEVVAPAGYALPTWPCRTTSLAAGETEGLEAFVSLRLPYVQAGYVDRLGKYVGGGIMIVKDSVGTPITLVADNGPLDVSKVSGFFAVMLPSAGKFVICAATPPAGYALPPGAAQCLGVIAKNGSIHFAGNFTLNPTPSAVWGVQDPFGALIGPSSFTVSIPREFISIPVVDNGINDLDPKVGFFLVKLPKAAVYTLCQTQAPPDRYLANPPCRTLDVTSGGSVHGGWFVNNEKQVYHPG